MTSFAESTVEDVALSWLAGLRAALPRKRSGLSGEVRVSAVAGALADKKEARKVVESNY